MKLTRIAARSVLLLSAFATVLLAGCGQRRGYYAPVGYGAPPPVIVIHHGGGYGGGYGAPPTVVHVYHHNGYGGGFGGGGFGGGRTVIVHHHY